MTQVNAVGDLRSVYRNDSPEHPDGGALDGQVWDVFLSHASEDKERVAQPLYDALTGGGLRVWLDEKTMAIGDSLRRSIDQGIRSSRFSIIVLSPHYIKNGWPQHELDGIVGLMVGNQQRVLPIWHELGADDIRNFSPSLADKVARSTASTSIGAIADEVLAVVRLGDCP